MTSTRGHGGRQSESAHTEHTLVSTTTADPTARSSTAANSVPAVRSGAAANSATGSVVAATVPAGTVGQAAGERPSRASNPRSEQALINDTHHEGEPSYLILDVDDGVNGMPEYSFFCRRTPTRGVRGDHIDFVLDSASISNIMRPEDASLLIRIADDPVTLIGVGNVEVTSEKSGLSVFGKTRIMSQKHNLVSQYEVRRIYKVVEENEDCFRLEPRHVQSSLLRWWFVRDQHRYGDLLLHCTVPRQRFKDAMRLVTEECLNLYYDSPLVSDSSISIEERSILDKTQLLHEDLNHASAQSLLRTIKSHMKTTGLDSFNGVSITDVEMWHKVRGGRCSGCLRGKLTDHHHKATSVTNSFAPGEAAGGDLMFVELKEGESMKPLLVTVDVTTQLGTVTTLKDRSTESIYDALAADQALKKSFGKPIKTLFLTENRV